MSSYKSLICDEIILCPRQISDPESERPDVLSVSDPTTVKIPFCETGLRDSIVGNS